MQAKQLKIGYVAGKASRFNERIIDHIWLDILSEYSQLVEIPPFAFIKLFGGSINQWSGNFPAGLDSFIEKLNRVRSKYRFDILYMNIPIMVPYLLLARSIGKLNIRFLFFAHSIGLQYWLKQWIAIAPWLSESDILICPSHSCKKALNNISAVFQSAICIPHSIKTDERRGVKIPDSGSGANLLSIGRLEDVKNIDLLLEAFVEILKIKAGVTLTIAGEYTGNNEEQISNYKTGINTIIMKHRLTDRVKFTGPVAGEKKARCFQEADLLINLSTDPGETFGYNLVEAKYYGLPVICTRWDGFPEVVDDQVDGIMVDCMWQNNIPRVDRQSIVNAVTRLLDNKDEYRCFSKNALGNLRKWNYRNNVPEILKVVENSLNEDLRLPECPADIAATPLNKLDKIYNMVNLQKLDCWQDKTILAVLTDDYYFDLKEWMPKVKPVIKHFAVESITYTPLFRVCQVFKH